MATKYEIGKSKREALGIEVNKMAELIGCSTTVVYKYERGDDISLPYVTAYWTVLDRLQNSITPEESKVAELKSRINTFKSSDRYNIKIKNLTAIIKAANDLIYSISEEDRRIRLEETQSSLSALTSRGSYSR